MENKKRVLLIAGGGTLGRYTAKELLRLGHAVDIICLEDYTSNNPDLRYFKEAVSLEFLKELFAENKYDGVVNFIHYPEVADYAPYHELLAENCDHLIFLSSYRTYADLEHPITETSPKLIDVVDDPNLHQNEKYAMSKSRCERYLHAFPGRKNWTVVRPVISFSDRRLDILTHSGHDVLEKEVLYMPLVTKNLHAGLDWAGNSGKLIANLLFKPGTIGEAYTITTGQNLTWGQVAEEYTAVTGVKFEWVSMEEFLRENPRVTRDPFYLKYDRLYDRETDPSKVFAATGLGPDDFTTIREGIEIEVEIVRNQK